MCLILTAYRADPRYRLVLAANRDEYFRRPTKAADYWPEMPHILGGRDLEKGGTWLAVTTDGRWAAITNFRSGNAQPTGARSRGALVADYLAGPFKAQAYVADVEPDQHAYPGFNLLTGDNESLHYLSNKDAGPMMLAPGIYGLSNHLLDSPWPKVELGKRALAESLAAADEPDRLIETLLAALGNRSLAEDQALPSTGISRDWEKRLSAAFIEAPHYGTRASTVLLIDREGEAHFRERSYGERGELIEDRRYRFTLTAQRSGPAF